VLAVQTAKSLNVPQAQNCHCGQVIQVLNKINQRLDIPGMMFEKELNILSRAASLVKNNGHILEIGACFGRSTHALYLGKSESVSLTTVDIWGVPIPMNPGSFQGSPELLNDLLSISANYNDTKFGFLSAIGSECASSINVIQSRSEDFESNINYDLVFIDGDHSYEGVKKDLSRYVYNENTLIIGDDFLNGQSELVDAVLENRYNRILIAPSPNNCKLFFLVPSQGYWFEKNKFLLNSNFGLLSDTLIFTYNPYEITNYAEGQTELKIPMSLFK
jgi:predicted O-methyltransferase YrrM